MLTPTSKLLLEDDTLELHKKILSRENKIYKKLEVCYAKQEKIDNDYDKGLISDDEVDRLTDTIDIKIAEYNRQLEVIESEEYNLFDNLETLV